VTQAFNTTSSMGRLTLNVLLSFAQFEREVTGERIRDKIAASKAKGMWMGGVPPLGYDVPAPGNRILQVNETEAGQVRSIFLRYLELGSVHRLQQELEAAGVRSKQRVTASGRTVGGVILSRGALFHMLRNRIYLGEIPHKGQTHPGQHAAIIEPALFDAVQIKLGEGRRSLSSERRVTGALLTGRIVDAAGEVMSPAFSYGRGGRVYRYYVSTSLQKGGPVRDDAILRRIPAKTIEGLVQTTLERLLPGRADVLCELRRVEVTHEQLLLVLPSAIARLAAVRLADGEALLPGQDDTGIIAIPVHLPLRGGAAQIAAGLSDKARPDPVLIAALRKAHAMLDWPGALPSLNTAPASAYDRRILRLALLAPDMQRDILAGRQPARFNLALFMSCDVPLEWDAQRRLLGWSSAPC